MCLRSDYSPRIPSYVDQELFPHWGISEPTRFKTYFAHTHRYPSLPGAKYFLGTPAHPLFIPPELSSHQTVPPVSWAQLELQPKIIIKLINFFEVKSFIYSKNTPNKISREYIVWQEIWEDINLETFFSLLQHPSSPGLQLWGLVSPFAIHPLVDLYRQSIVPLRVRR